MNFVYEDGGRHKYFKAKNVGDCVTRAIANATGADYKLVYKSLAKMAGETPRNGVDRKVIKKFLSMLGWDWTPTMSIGAGCQVHLDAHELPEGTLIVSLSQHITCVDDGTIYDTYDCSRGETRCVYGYWSPLRSRATPSHYESILNEYLKKGGRK